MNRNELYKEVSKVSGIQMKDVKEIGNVLFDTIRNTVSVGGKVSINNFGTFGAKMYESRPFFNPLKQEMETLPARAVPKFTPSKSFKDDCQV